MEDDEGKKRAILNKKETAIAQSKQELIKQGFQDWVWRCLLYTSSEDMITAMYKKAVTNSVAYMMMTRLGIDTEPLFEAEDFTGIGQCLSLFEC